MLQLSYFIFKKFPNLHFTVYIFLYLYAIYSLATHTRTKRRIALLEPKATLKGSRI